MMIVDRMKKDVAMLQLAVEQNAEDAWLQASLIDLAASHTGRLRKLEKVASGYVPLSELRAWARAEAERFSEAAAEKFGAPPIPVADWLPEIPASKDDERLNQLRKSLVEGLDADEPHIASIRKWLLAISKVEKQNMEDALAAGTWLDDDARQRWADDFSRNVIEWSKAHLSREQWDAVVDEVIGENG
jgi:hypothetical protein